MFEPIAQRFRHWQLRNLSRRKLSQLDDRLLGDMGIDRRHIGDYVARLDRDGGRSDQ